MSKVLLSCIILIFLSFPLSAAPNQYEMAIIQSQIKKSFNSLIAMWMEELYFDMYEKGQKNSKKRLSLEEFAQRMVDLSWKLSDRTIKSDRIEIIYRNFAIIYLKLEFEHKVNSSRKIIRSIVFPTILEEEDWKFDLSQFIRIPYVGKIPEEKKEEKPPEEKKPEAAEAPAEGAAPAQQP